MNKAEKPKEQNDGKVEVFCRYIVKNGKKIYPKNGKFFHFFAEPKKS